MFFETKWTRPKSSFDDEYKSTIFNDETYDVLLTLIHLTIQGPS